MVAIVHGCRVSTHQEPPRQHPVRLHGWAQIYLPLLIDVREALEGWERARLTEGLVTVPRIYFRTRYERKQGLAETVRV